MSYSPVLAPVVALVAWTLVMLVWLALARRPFVANRDGLPPGTRGADLPPGAHNWPAHNYAHLVEQPTLFYAIALILAVLGDKDPMTAMFAWAYVALRVVHSLVQATVNVVKVRFALFALASLVLLLLTIRTAAILVQASA